MEIAVLNPKNGKFSLINDRMVPWVCSFTWRQILLNSQISVENDVGWVLADSHFTLLAITLTGNSTLLDWHALTHSRKHIIIDSLRTGDAVSVKKAKAIVINVKAPRSQST